MTAPAHSGLPTNYDFHVRLEGRSATVELVQIVSSSSGPDGKWTANIRVPVASITVTPPSWLAWLFGDRLHLRVQRAGRELTKGAQEREATTKPPPDRTPRKYRADHAAVAGEGKP